MTKHKSELSKPVAWPNGCSETAVNALRYLAEKPRPSYGNSIFNTEHLYMIAREIERMASQHLYSQEYVSALLDVAIALREWIDAVPDEVAASLPTMPGVDRDWVDSVIGKENRNG